jgi:hypothetical protein
MLNFEETSKEIKNALKEKGYTFTTEIDYNNTESIIIDNELCIGEITIYSNGEAVKRLKLKNNKFEQMFNLDCEHFGETIYIFGYLPHYENVVKILQRHNLQILT